MRSSKGKTWMLVLAFLFLTGALLLLAVEACGGCGGAPGYRGYGGSEYGTTYCPRHPGQPCLNYGIPSGKKGAGYGGGYCCQLAYNQQRTNRVIRPEMEKDAKEKALKLYQDTYGKKDALTANVTDYGCHIQVDIYEKENLVKSYTYQQGNIFEM